MACAFDMSHCLTKEIIVKLSRFFRHDKRLFQRKLMINVKYRKKKFHKKKDFGCVTTKIHLILRAKIKSSAWYSEQWIFPTLHRVT